MSILQKLTYLFYFLLWSNIINAQAGILKIHPDSIPEYWERPLNDWALWNDNVPPEMNLQDVFDLPFELFDAKNLMLSEEQTCQWFKFNLVNLSDNDSLNIFLLLDNTAEEIELHFQEKMEWKKFLGGRHTKYNELGFKSNAFALPISLAPDVSANYYLRIYKRISQPEPIVNLSLVSQQSEIKKRALSQVNEIGTRSFNSFFLGVIFIFAILTLAYFFGKKDKAYLFYSFYLFAIFIFYFRHFETENRSIIPFTIFAKWHANIETLISYASFVFYIQFLRHFLDVRSADIKLDNYLRFGLIFFLAIIPIDLLLQYIFGTEFSIRVYNLMYIPFFVFSFFVIFLLWKKRLSSFAKFIIIGTVLLLLGIVPFRIAQLTHIEYDHVAWGSVRKFHLPFGNAYWYHTKVGFLLEIICFMIGLAWKTQQERQEIARLILRLNSLENNSNIISKPPPTEKKHPAKMQIAEQDDFLKKANLIIEEKYKDDKFLPSQLAADLNISYSHCAHLVKTKTGLSISLYIQQYRLQAAKELLRTTDLAIKQVAYQSGFNNPSYFSRLFKEVVGTSPSEWRSKQ